MTVAVQVSVSPDAAMMLVSGKVAVVVDGVRKVLTGHTTIEQILKITHRQDLKL